ncbi:hypothetical protein JOQ06_022988, partial [Pogonophryne albipinna]
KIIFGGGTRVTVETKEEYKPSFYKLEDETTSLCLATGFSRIRAADKDKSEIFNNRTGAVRIEGDSLFNQVGYLSSDQRGLCETDGGPVDCDDSLQPDPQVNLVSLTVLGLRLLFMKTVVFNVLLTLRLWITSYCGHTGKHPDAVARCTEARQEVCVGVCGLSLRSYCCFYFLLLQEVAARCTEK